MPEVLFLGIMLNKLVSFTIYVEFINLYETFIIVVFVYGDINIDIRYVINIFGYVNNNTKKNEKKKKFKMNDFIKNEFCMKYLNKK